MTTLSHMLGRMRRLLLALLTAFAVGGAPALVAAEPAPMSWAAPAAPSERVHVEVARPAPAAEFPSPVAAHPAVSRHIVVARLYLSLQSLLL